MIKNCLVINCIVLLTLSFSNIGIAEDQRKIGYDEKTDLNLDKLPEDKSSPSGYYIPKDLEDAFLILDKILQPDFKTRLKNKRKLDLLPINTRFGAWIIRNWINPPDSPLKEYFLSFGKEVNAEDMSMIIITNYWRRLNGKPVELKEDLESWDFFHKKNKKPIGLVSPIDGAEIQFIIRKPIPCEGENKYVYIEGVGKMPTACGPPVHLGWSKSDGTIWAYQYGEGLFEPDPALKKEFEELVKGSPIGEQRRSIMERILK